jgi:SAM-dependent methyltransferase
MDMSSYGSATYGDRIADFYDVRHPALPQGHPMIQGLAKLAGNGTALELGIGTGRVALPLAASGVSVHGIDASEAMVARLRSKPGGAAIPVTIGDFADLPVSGYFSLIYVVFNTFFGLLTQEDQIRCVANCAAHLDDGGALLIEAFYPDLTRYVRNQNISVMDVDTDAITVDVTQLDPVAQRVTSQHLYITPEGLRMFPVQLRYAWPTEIDLMARLAGLRLDTRSGGWRGEPYTAAPTMYVAIYRKQR